MPDFLPAARAALLCMSFLVASACSGGSGLASEQDQAIVFAVLNAGEQHEELSSRSVQGNVFSSVELVDRTATQNGLEEGLFRLLDLRPAEGETFLEVRKIEPIADNRWAIELAAISDKDFFGASVEVENDDGRWQWSTAPTTPPTTSVS